MSEHIVEKLKAADRLHPAFVAVLGRDVPSDRTAAIPCPKHQVNGCKTPAAVASPTYGRLSCKSCGEEWGLLDLGVQTGYAASPGLVAARLQQEFLGVFDGTRSSSPPPDHHKRVLAAMRTLEEHPESLRTAETWGLASTALSASCGGVELDDAGRPLRFLLPVYDVEGAIVGLKERRDPAKPPRSKNHGKPGLLNAHLVGDLEQDGWVVLCEGESDMLALQALVEEEDLPLAAVSPSNGASQDLSPLAPLFAGRRVAVCYDEDGAEREEEVVTGSTDPSQQRKGRLHGARAAAQLAAAAKEVRRVRLAFTPEQLDAGNNDLRDWLAIHRRGKPRTAQHVLEEIEEAKAQEVDPAARDAGVDLADLLVMEFPERRALAERMLTERKTAILFGDTHIGKSVLAWRIGMCAARGYGSVFGCAVNGPHRTGVFLGENDLQDASEAMPLMLQEDPPVRGAMRWWDVLARPEPPDLGTKEGQAWYLRVIREQGIELAIFDTITMLVHGDLSDRQVARDTHQFFGTLNRLGCTVIGVMHPRKGSGKKDEGSSMDRLYGAQEWSGLAPTVIEVAWENPKKKDPNRILVRCDKARGIRPKERLGLAIVSFDEDTLDFNLVHRVGRGEKIGNPGHRGPSVTTLQIRDLLKANAGQLMSRAKIAEELGCSLSAVKKRVLAEEFQEWMNEGLIEDQAVGRGTALVWLHDGFGDHS